MMSYEGGTVRMQKRFLWAGLIAALTVTVVGSSAAMTGKVGQSSKAQANVLRMSLGAEPPSLDPGLATDTTSANVLFNIMDPLIRLGKPPLLKATPGAATKWSVKGKVVTLTLRRNVRWTNGQPVKAADYVWSWLRTISPELAADYAYQFDGIKGAHAYNACESNCDALRSQVGVKAVGPYKLRITLVSPQPWFVQQLSHTSFLPVNRAAVTKYGNKWTEPGNIVTDGPFKLSSWKHDASLTLVKNTKWRNAKSVKLTRIEHPIITDGTTAENAFSAGNIDINGTGVPPVDIPKWKKTSFWKQYKALGTYYYGFNVKNITNVNQRRAMAYAIDRKSIIKYITQSGQVPAKGFTPNGIAGGPLITKNSSMPATAKMSEAKSLLAKVSNPKRNIRLFVNNSPGHVKIATAVQASWKELGLDATIRVLEWKQYLQFLGPPPNSDVDVYRLGWIYDFPDAYNGLVLWTCNSGNNNTNWCNKKYDGLIKKAERTPNNTKRFAIYKQAEDIMTGPKGDLPVMPIYWYTFSALVKNNVHGFFINPSDQFDFTKVSVS
jgi:oligopeptide transport system substrate-binding protein